MREQSAPRRPRSTRTTPDNPCGGQSARRRPRSTRTAPVERPGGEPLESSPMRTLWVWLLTLALAVAEPTLPVSLDPAGPYLILASARAEKAHPQALAQALKLHPRAITGRFDLPELAGATALLKRHRPHFTLVVLMPDELDTNLAWKWLEKTAGLDADPFVDTRTGFLIAPEGGAYFQRLTGVLSGRERVPAVLVDNLGPMSQGLKIGQLQSTGSSFFLSGLSGLKMLTLSHGPVTVPAAALESMSTAGVLHLGGHGLADRIVDGMTASQARQLQLPPAFVFNGCCYGGVTGRYHEAGKWQTARTSFCLALLSRRPLAYFASLHPDHGMPVYQEIERLAWQGGSSGDLIKSTHDEVILALGTSRMPRLQAGQPTWSPGQFMLYGTASRVLFGDPAVVLGLPRVKAPLSHAEGEVRVDNPALQATLTDTFSGDLCSTPNMFNARAVFLLSGQKTPVKITGVRVGQRALRFRVVGQAVELGKGLRVQVDCESTGMFRSPFFSRRARIYWQ